MTLQRVYLPSPNYSSRGGATVRLLVVHTAEGARTIESLGNYFADPASGVSSHAGADDKANTIGEFVKPDQKSWTQGNANPAAMSIELCAFAAWTPAEWDAHPDMLANCAAWLAEESARFSIPLVALTPDQAQSSGRGVCQHIDLGSWGGGHVDCGPAFPMARVLSMAAGGGGQPPPGVVPAPVPPAPAEPAPPWPGRYFDYPPLMSGADIAQWQEQMHFRGWPLIVDGLYGPESMGVCFDFQTEKHLVADGIVGPETWAAAWTAPIT